ncbi:MAG TPA: EamA family transporter [Candidatus Desulfaltia sp.]|nr:EamA family transporter [Candidatus Desulfaltia sp.]
MADARVRGVLEALLVTFLWSSSYVLTKIGLQDTPPLLLVALRYVLASVVLLSVAFARGAHRELDRGTAVKLALLGVSGYAVAQGLQCLGLFYLPAVTVTFILNFTPVMVLAFNAVTVGYRPTTPQLVGVLMVLGGAYIYFGGRIEAGNLLGVAITLLSGLGWAVYLVAGRRFFADRSITPLALSAFAMASGTVLIAGSAAVFEGLRPVSPQSLAIILWLGVVNTAAAFFIWNRALAKVGAFEISILQNTMLIQIAVLSWMFLGETLSSTKMLGMGLVFTGVLIVQLSSLRGGGRS